MEKLITLKIERLEENGEVYYLATSDDVQGLVAQGSTIDEVVEIAEDLIKLIYELDKEWEKQPKQSLPNVIEYPLEICI